MKNPLLYVWFQLALGVCNRLSRDVFDRFQSIEDVYNCSDFSFLGEKCEKYINRLESKDTSEAYEVLKRCKSLGVRITGFYDELYPASLRSIESPPAAFYSIGELKSLNDIPCAGMVGTRNMTDYGREITERFAYAFAKSGVCVVSGLARGVDTAAHRGAVMADGYTVAVLGNPIGDVYPKENEKAFRTLYERGLVLSEMYPGCPRTRADFPNRNRIISGLSDVVVVTEAGEHSGALITANHAKRQGKLIFAVPGAIGAENAGTNNLIKIGTPAATDPRDVLLPLLSEYPRYLRLYESYLTEQLHSYGNAAVSKNAASKPPLGTVKKKSPRPEPAFEAEPRLSDDGNELSAKILSAFSAGENLSADEISARIGVPVSEVLAELTMMELCGSVSAAVGGRFRKC